MFTNWFCAFEGDEAPGGSDEEPAYEEGDEEEEGDDAPD